MLLFEMCIALTSYSKQTSFLEKNKKKSKQTGVSIPLHGVLIGNNLLLNFLLFYRDRHTYAELNISIQLNEKSGCISEQFDILTVLFRTL
jgi:hypothetical protein